MLRQCSGQIYRRRSYHNKCDETKITFKVLYEGINMKNKNIKIYVCSIQSSSIHKCLSVLSVGERKICDSSPGEANLVK